MRHRHEKAMSKESAGVMTGREDVSMVVRLLNGYGQLFSARGGRPHGTARSKEGNIS